MDRLYYGSDSQLTGEQVYREQLLLIVRHTPAPKSYDHVAIEWYAYYYNSVASKQYALSSQSPQLCKQLGMNNVHRVHIATSYYSSLGHRGPCLFATRLCSYLWYNYVTTKFN